MNTQHVISWGHPALALEIVTPLDGPPRLASLRSRGVPFTGASTGMALVEVGVLGHGRSWSAARYADSVVGAALRYTGHETGAESGVLVLHVDAADASTGLTVRTTLRTRPGIAAVQISSQVTATAPLTVEWITSLAVGGLGSADDLDLHHVANDWLAEGRWQVTAARTVLPDLHRAAHQHASRGRFGLTASGAWSCDGHLPMGALTRRDSGATVLWQVEHNGAWHWQVGERDEGVYVAALGPTEAEHQWCARLGGGASFATVPATLVLGSGGVPGALAELTAHRRATRRASADHANLPVVFNDYMNTLMGDPTTAKLLPLVDAAAAAGAEYFCIDAGWYADGTGWWESVGAWEPAPGRFPGGIEEVLDHIRAAGMVPGLWLEPEVIGVASPLASRLPDDAFFRRHGERVTEHGRHQLDLRHPEARKHLDDVVDRLVVDLGVGYLKLDHNISAGVGTDVGADSAGAGLLGHNRAVLDWLDGVLDRHPGLVLENCASGGLRADHAMVSRSQLQSTSDQQDPLRYPPIAAAAASIVAPEQAASWAYPQPGFDDDLAAFTLCNGLLGRLHLSGHLDRMAPRQLALVASAVRVYREIRGDIAAGTPFWPIGLPGWDDPWVGHGITTATRSHVVLWRRAGAAADVALTVPAAAVGGAVTVRFPAAAATTAWEAGTLRVGLPAAPSAVLITVQHAGS